MLRSFPGIQSTDKGRQPSGASTEDSTAVHVGSGNAIMGSRGLRGVFDRAIRMLHHGLWVLRSQLKPRGARSGKPPLPPTLGEVDHPLNPLGTWRVHVSKKNAMDGGRHNSSCQPKDCFQGCGRREKKCRRRFESATSKACQLGILVKRSLADLVSCDPFWG